MGVGLGSPGCHKWTIQTIRNALWSLVLHWHPYNNKHLKVFKVQNVIAILSTVVISVWISGLLSINVSDPGYMNQPLFQYEIGVRCPNYFNLTFGVPNGDMPFIDKDFIVTVRDQMTTYHLNIYRPRSRIVLNQASSKYLTSFITDCNWVLVQIK